MQNNVLALFAKYHELFLMSIEIKLKYNLIFKCGRWITLESKALSGNVYQPYQPVGEWDKDLYKSSEVTDQSHEIVWNAMKLTKMKYGDIDNIKKEKQCETMIMTFKYMCSQTVISSDFGDFCFIVSHDQMY